MRNEAFAKAVKAAATDLLTWPENFSDPHVHFDQPEFNQMVPEFSALVWLELAQAAVAAVQDVSGSFLIYVPLQESCESIGQFDLRKIKELQPWEPPSIHFLRDASAFGIREDGPLRWYADKAPPVDGALGWLSASRDDESEAWRVALMYETQPSPL